MSERQCDACCSSYCWRKCVQSVILRGWATLRLYFKLKGYVSRQHLWTIRDVISGNLSKSAFFEAVGGRRPFRLKFTLKVTNPFRKTPTSRHFRLFNVLTVRDIEKNSIMTNRKSNTGFPMSYKLRWSAYVTPKSAKGWLKSDFLNKIQFQ